jgi:hypothetical protein
VPATDKVETYISVGLGYAGHSNGSPPLDWLVSVARSQCLCSCIHKRCEDEDTFRFRHSAALSLVRTLPCSTQRPDDAAKPFPEAGGVRSEASRGSVVPCSGAMKAGLRSNWRDQSSLLLGSSKELRFDLMEKRSGLGRPSWT